MTAVEPTALAERLRQHQRSPTPYAVKTIVFDGALTRIGRFRCDPAHTSFRDSGPASGCIVVFPRTSVWIQHEGSRRFVADPNVVTIYNRGQRYERFPISPEGDRCDWFAVADSVARDVVGRFDPAAGESPDRPYRFERAPSSMALYARQRRIVRRAQLGLAAPLEIEEEVLAIVEGVLECAYGQAWTTLLPAASVSTGASRGAAARRHRDLAEATRAELARTAEENRSVSEIARAVGASPFHLCRVFRAHTGQTMHRYRVSMRLRVALERLETPANAATLSAVAHELGFASHAHFVKICQRDLGAAPSAVRHRVAAGTP